MPVPIVAVVLIAMSLVSPAFGADAGLAPGEYSCVGSGGDVLIGLGFRLSADGTYTDLDATTSGTYTIDPDGITFSGGHLDGYTGRDIHDNGFTIADMASCQLWSN